MMQIPNLRRLRQRRNWSQQDLADRSGIGLSTIIRLEHGAACRYVTVRKLAEALGVPEEELARPVEDAEPVADQLA